MVKIQFKRFDNQTEEMGLLIMANPAVRAKQIVQRATKGNSNFMTPDVIKYGLINNDLAYELSKGEGFKRGTTVYGVTVCKHEAGEYSNVYDLGKALFVWEEVLDYIDHLQEEYSILDPNGASDLEDFENGGAAQ